MIKEGKIGVSEAVSLVVIATSNRVFFTAPTVVEQFTGTAGWYMSILSNAVTILFFTFIYLLLKRFPGKDLLEIFHISFGRIIGFLFSIVYASSFLAACGILLREFYEMLKSFILPNTPISVLNGAMVVMVIVAVFLGLETIARTAKLAAFFALIGYLALLILAAEYFKLSNLFPILGYGMDNTIKEGITRSSAYSEVIILAVFAGSLQGVRHIKKAGYLSLILSGLLVSISIFCMQLIFPFYTFQEQTAPLYTLATLIKYGTFFQRLDPAFLTLWVVTTIISSSVVFYCAVSSYCKTFRMQDRRPVIIPMGILVYAVAMIPADFPSVISVYIELLRTYPIFLFYILPMAALITSIVRKKKEVDSLC
ncbi:MAG: spore germination protein [Clostridia bacterium]|nr:spore germination protein [Clostridia bacterium]